MNRLEDELRQVFKREDPGPNFTARLLTRIEEEKDRKPGLGQLFIGSFRRPAPALMMSAFVILFIAVIAGVYMLRQPHIAKPAQAVLSPGNYLVEKPKQIEPEGLPGKTEGTAGGQIKYVRPHGTAKHIPPSVSIREGELAKEQLIKAMLVASSTINRVNASVERELDKARPPRIEFPMGF